MRVVSVAQMREADRRCIQDIGIPGVVLMNNAGLAVFREISQGPVGVVCGKGNNGGDGFVVARLAMLAGLETRVVLVSPPKVIGPDAAVYMHAYERLGGRVEAIEETEAIQSAMARLGNCAVIVDSLLGTGVKGEVEGSARAAIDAWPRVYTIAVDVPSGMNADTGEPCGRCVKADLTVSLQFLKTGFEQPAAKSYIGRVIVADIGIPDVCADDEAWAKLTGW